MSGHSKWATIKRKRAATDSKRGRLFTRILREVQVAAKLGGGSIDGNARLKTAVNTAKAASVPGDNIDRAIKRGCGQLEGVDYEEILYEGFGPGGVALLMKVLTDNRNRIVSELRNILTKAGGSLAGANAVSYLFKERGVATVQKNGVSEEQLMEATIEAGVEDIRDTGKEFELLFDPRKLEPVREAITKVCKEFEAEVRLVADMQVAVSGDNAKTLIELLESLDDLDDVQNVFSNFEMSDADMEALE